MVLRIRTAIAHKVFLLLREMPTSPRVAISLPLFRNRVQIVVGLLRVSALVDSDSDVCIISEDFRQRIHAVATPWRG